MKFIISICVSIMLLVSCAKKEGRKNGQDNRNPFLQSSLVIEGELFQDLAVDPSDPSGTQTAYWIQLTLYNTGNGPITYSEVEAAFRAGSGDSLKILLLPGEQTEHEGRISTGVSVALKPGESTVIPGITTNSHTNRLISHAQEQGLLLAVRLMDAGKPVAGPYCAVLPDLDTLKKTAARTQRPEVSGYHLVFYR